MPRVARLNTPGGCYHIIARFVDRSWFLRDDEERETYLRMFTHAMSQTDWRCLAYALMSNHLHFAMIAGTMPLASWAIAVHSPFAHWMNARHRRLGPVFAHRPSDRELLPERQRNLIAYIHNNPVRAGVVGRARDTTWTSHRAYVGLAAPPAWLHVTEGLEYVGTDDIAIFDDFVAGQVDAFTMADMRAAHRETRRRGALRLATPSDTTIPIVARPFGHVRPDPRTITRIVAATLRVSEMELCSRQRREDLVRARRVVVHCGKQMGICGSDLAAVLGISEQAVSKMAHLELDDETRRMVVKVRELVGLHLS